MNTALALAGLLAATTVALAEELKTTHLFGFRLGTPRAGLATSLMAAHSLSVSS